MKPSSSRTPEPTSTVLSASETAKVSTFVSALENSELTGASRANIDACRRPPLQSGRMVFVCPRPVIQWPATSCDGRRHFSVKVGGVCGRGLVSVRASVSTPSAALLVAVVRVKPPRLPATAMSKPPARTVRGDCAVIPLCSASIAATTASTIALPRRNMAVIITAPPSMMQLETLRAPRDLMPKIARVFELSAAKIRSIEDSWRPQDGAPVFTVNGRYQARGWTEWTQGFQFGSALLQFDATGDAAFLELGRSRTVERMAPHLTHMGVHDHGFNNVSTYGNLWRLGREHRIETSDWERRFYELALKASGAVQARRWTRLPSGGFIHSFNGAHSLFVDTMRSLRALALADRLGQPLMEEQDEKVSLLERLVQHARATAQFNVYYGRGRDRYDVLETRGRTA